MNRTATDKETQEIIDYIVDNNVELKDAIYSVLGYDCDWTNLTLEQRDKIYLDVFYCSGCDEQCYSTELEYTTENGDSICNKCGDHEY